MPPPSRHSPRVRRRRRRLLTTLSVASGCVLLLVAVLVGTGSSPGRGGRTVTTSTATSTTVGTTVVAHGGPYAVGTTSLPFVEPATATLAARQLPTAVRYPAQGRAGGTEAPGLAPDRADGPYPLVVFSQGYGIAAEAYAGMLEHWASAGYVVVDPTYPFTDPSFPGGLNEADLVNHPADLRYVIASILALSAARGNVLSGLVDPNEVAVIGHSDGGDVSLATAVDPCCQDSLVKAAVILSGAEQAVFGSAYYAQRSVPLMVVQGTADTINPPSCSVQLYDAAPAPKYYLSLLGAAHEPPYLDPGPTQTLVETTTTDFLNGYLKGRSAALAALVAAGTIPGQATVSAAASVGPPVGSCPGAPAG